MKRKLFIHLAIVALICGVVQTADASSISPINGTSSDVRLGAIVNVIDGNIDYDSYLFLGKDTDPISSFYGNLIDPSSVRFELSQNFNLIGMDLWNNAGYIEYDGEGINAFTLKFFSDSLSVIGSYDGSAIDRLAVQSFAFPLMNNVKYVDLMVHSNHSASHPAAGLPANGLRDYAAFYEIKFNTVPEPATMLLLGFGLMGLAGVRRFKK